MNRWVVDLVIIGLRNVGRNALSMVVREILERVGPLSYVVLIIKGILNTERYSQIGRY